MEIAFFDPRNQLIYMNYLQKVHFLEKQRKNPSF